MKFQTTAMLANVLFLVCGPLQTVGLSQFLLGTGSETLREYRDISDVVVVGELTFAVPANKARKFPGSCAVAIREIIKDTSQKFETGELITIRQDFKLATGERFLLIGVTRNQENNWRFLEKSSPAAAQYLRKAPDADATQTEQLTYYLPFLTHADPVIARDAFSEINTNADLELIAKTDLLKKLLDRELLRKSIANDLAESETIAHRGMYALLLGFCGDEDDAEFLKAIIQEKRDEPLFETRGVICGYLLLTGTQGLDFVDETILKKSPPVFHDQIAALQALRFMEGITVKRVAHDRLCQSLRILLDQPGLADLVIVDLAKWSDWSIMDQLMTLYTKKEFDNPQTKRAIVRYLFSATKSWNETTGETVPTHVLDARRHLKSLEKVDPKTVRQAKFYFF